MQNSTISSSAATTPASLLAQCRTHEGGILFDFDGTLANTTPGIVATLRASFEAMGRPVPAEDAMVKSIGLPLNQAFCRLGEFSKEEAATAVSTYAELFMTHEIPTIELFPKVKTTLEQLHEQGIRMAIVTSRNRHSLELILERHDIQKYFETNVTFDDGITPKPAPDMVLELLDKMHLAADSTLVVGDTTFDIEMGNRAGCHTCAVSYGNHDIAMLQTAYPEFIIHRLGELL